MGSLLATIQIIGAIGCWYLAIWGRLLGVEPFVSFLYFFAWWPLLAFLDGVLWRHEGTSRLWHRPREFVRLLFFSVTVWLIFEVCNLRLLNWRYVGIEPRLWIRWPGYALAFSTVLPGIFFTAEVLRVLGVGAGLKGRPRHFPSWPPTFLLLGVACVLLPIMVPSYAFPLVWLAFFFLGDPLLELVAGRSLTGRFLQGERQEQLCLVLAGLLCGIWWELWNYPSLARWIYTLPILNFGKIFEMPVTGYLGFLPFALECRVMYELLCSWEESLGKRHRHLFYGVQLGFWLLVFWALDRYTVLSFQ